MSPKTTGRKNEHLMHPDLRYYLGLSGEGGGEVRQAGRTMGEFLAECEAAYGGPVSGPWMDEMLVSQWLAGAAPEDTAADASYQHECRKADRNV